MEFTPSRIRSALCSAAVVIALFVTGCRAGGDGGSPLGEMGLQSTTPGGSSAESEAEFDQERRARAWIAWCKYDHGMSGDWKSPPTHRRGEAQDAANEHNRQHPAHGAAVYLDTQGGPGG